MRTPAGEIKHTGFADAAAGNLARDVLGGMLLHAADLVLEISDDAVNADRAMRWGFAWGQGPFELLDRIGPGRVISLLRREGRRVPRMLALLERSGAASVCQKDAFLGVDGRMRPLPPERRAR